MPEDAMNANEPAPAVVVGIDGSTASAAALRWGMREAALHRLALRLVCGFAWPSRALTYGLPPEAWADEDLRRNAIKTMEELVGSTAEFVPVVPADGDAVEHAAAPIAVGIDGSDTASLAARFAFDEAALRGVPVIAVRAWTPAAHVWPTGLPGLTDGAARERTERDLLTACLARWRRQHPRVHVELRATAGHPAQSLVTAAQNAQLLVVGSRGLGGFRGLLLGSVSSAVLHHAVCPVAIVHPQHHAGPTLPESVGTSGDERA